MLIIADCSGSMVGRPIDAMNRGVGDLYAVKVVSTVRVNGDNTAKVFAGCVVGGKLHYQRRECLDVRFRDPSRIRSGDLAFESDRRALQTWGKMKERHMELSEKRPLAGGCPRCGSSSVRLRQDPHHKAYRCRSCRRTF